VEVDVLEIRPFEVRTRFELAAARMADAWLHAGDVRVSAEDFRIARDYLERDGWLVEQRPGLRVRLCHRGFFSEEMTREEAVLVAFRRLVLPATARRTAVLACDELSVEIELSVPARSDAAVCRAGSPA
jgi:hypothetical protein